jgi:sec-independent protein translocase protein TatA
MTVGPLELLLILFVVLLLIGPRRIVDMSRSLGRAVRDFKLEFDRDKEAVGSQRTAISQDKEDETDS